MAEGVRGYGVTIPTPEPGDGGGARDEDRVVTGEGTA